jgi:hypothetical protein
MLLAHNQTFIKNIELLQKSKADYQADATLRKQSTHNEVSIDEDIKEPTFFTSDSENEELLQYLDESFNAETLIAAFYLISRT